MGIMKPLIVGVLLISSPFLVEASSKGFETAFSAYDCRFDQQKMDEMRAVMPDYDFAQIEQQLSGKSCTEAMKWIDEKWKSMHGDAEKATGDWLKEG